MSRPHTIEIDAYMAIAHPIRRKLIAALARGERCVGELASGFSITLPAVSQHLRVLRRAGLVRQRRRGRQRLYRLNTAPLRNVSRWVDRQVDG